jgi:hypothetical protein
LECRSFPFLPGRAAWFWDMLHRCMAILNRRQGHSSYFVTVACLVSIVNDISLHRQERCVKALQKCTGISHPTEITILIRIYRS